MALSLLVIGDDYDIPVTLNDDGSFYNVSAATSIKAVIASNADDGVNYCSEVNLVSGAPGSDRDWETGMS